MVRPSHLTTSLHSTFLHCTALHCYPTSRGEPQAHNCLESCRELCNGNCSLQGGILGLSLYTLHCTLYTVHCTLYTVHCTLYTLHCTLYTVHCIVSNIVLCIVYIVQCIVDSVVLCIVLTVQTHLRSKAYSLWESIVDNIIILFYTLHSVV